MSHQTGKCFCGEVRFRLNAEIANVVNCHCNFCRSHSGGAFSTYAALPYAAFEITDGKESLRTFGTGNGSKHFCGECGTPIFNLNGKYPGACMVYLGTLERCREILPKVNVWCESKLGWIESTMSLPSMAQGFVRK